MIDNLCPSCETFPPHIIAQAVKENGEDIMCFECRDCGDYWEEFPENFLKNDIE